MSGERIVTIRVSDPGIEYLKVGMYEADGSKIGKGLLVPVPPDDQMVKDVELAARALEARAFRHKRQVHLAFGEDEAAVGDALTDAARSDKDAAARLRAALGPDEESDDE